MPFAASGGKLLILPEQIPYLEKEWEMEVLMNKLYIMAIACSLASCKLSADYLNRYTKLQHTSGYEGMSMLAIAAILEDFDALKHFLPTSSRNDLVETQALLKSNLDILKKQLHQKIPRETIDPVSENESDRHKNIHQQIYRIKNSLAEIAAKLLHESD